MKPPKFNEYNLKLIIFLGKLGIKSADAVQLAKDIRALRESKNQSSDN